MVKFDYKDVAVGDILICVRNCDCCWREGTEYEVQKANEEDGYLFMTGSCEAVTVIDDHWDNNNSLPMHEIFELKKMGGPW